MISYRLPRLILLSHFHFSYSCTFSYLSPFILTASYLIISSFLFLLHGLPLSLSASLTLLTLFPSAFFSFHILFSCTTFVPFVIIIIIIVFASQIYFSDAAFLLFFFSGIFSFPSFLNSRFYSFGRHATTLSPFLFSFTLFILLGPKDSTCNTFVSLPSPFSQISAYLRSLKPVCNFSFIRSFIIS